ncbi:hypothetical protein GCM10018783_00580 [Streptomyces griseosporeus]|nr:hypothetical protein GCM10018783_00580 [Streptomyces griseosporeus]
MDPLGRLIRSPNGGRLSLIARNLCGCPSLRNPLQSVGAAAANPSILVPQPPNGEADMTLRFIGTTSDEGDCSTLYEIPETDEILVQGDRETDPGHLVQLRDVKPSETFVRVPRSLLVRYAPRTDGPQLQPFSAIAHLFREFRHTAWRLETRRGYASDRRSPKWQRWQAEEHIAAEPSAWLESVAAHTAAGKRFERVRLVDEPATEGQRFLLASAPGNVAAGEDIRNLTRTQAEQLRLPDYDFWLSTPRSWPGSRSTRTTPRSACTSRRTRRMCSPPARPETPPAPRCAYNGVREAGSFHFVSTDHQTAREALGARLRELRAEAGLEGKQITAALGWQTSKVPGCRTASRPPPARISPPGCRPSAGQTRSGSCTVRWPC